MTSRKHLFIALALLTCPACAVEGDEEDFRFMPGNSGGGTVFNTNEMDDFHFSEITHATEWKSQNQPLQVQDPNIPGIRMIQLVLESGTNLVAFRSEGGSLVGFDAANNTYKDDDFVDSEWTIKHQAWKQSRTMRLVEAEFGGDFPRYRFVHIPLDGKGAKVEVANCPEGQTSAGETGHGQARLLSGFSLDEPSGDITASSRTTYFACDTGATGKAVDLGFYEWVLENTPAEVEDHWLPLELAIRVIRADYCYTGDSFTAPGKQIYIEDSWGIIDAPSNPDAPVEAVWGTQGLLCRGNGRQVSIDCGDDLPVCDPNVTLADYPDARFITRLTKTPGQVEWPIPIDLPPINDLPPGPPLPTIPTDPTPVY